MLGRENRVGPKSNTSALGHKRTCAVQNDVMSALPPKATEIADIDVGQRALLLCPCKVQNVNLLRYCKSIIHIDAEIPDSTLYFGVAEQKLDRSQIPCAAVDQCRFGSPQTNAYRT